MLTRYGCVAMAGAFLASALPAETVSLKSPDGKNEIRLIAGESLQYSVIRNGKVRVAPSAISLTIEGRDVSGAHPKISGRQERAVSGTIPTPIYKKAEIRQDAREAEVAFAGGYRVILHAANDGVAYRFSTDLGDRIKVTDEQADIRLPSPEPAAYAGLTGDPKNAGQDKLQSSWESIYRKIRIADIDPDRACAVYLPLLLEYPDGGLLCVTESDLRDYPGWNLTRDGKDSAGFVSWFAQAPVSEADRIDQRHRFVQSRKPWIAETAGTRVYPWRVFILADQPIQLVESDIVYALAAPSGLADATWVKPGVAAWDWWCDWNVSGVDFRAGYNTATYQYFVDFAIRNKLPYMLFDGGWAPNLDVMSIKPEIDLPGLVKYAADHGVAVILWSSWSQMYGRQREVFKKYSAMGVKGFKIDYMDRDDQDVVRFIEETAAIAAEYKLVIDYHGMFKPTGLQRTYPNVLNFEGVHGLEMLKFKSDTDVPHNDCQIVFTRMVAGPVDYTPGAMINQTRKAFTVNRQQPSSQGTRVHQMALMSLFEAPLQMLCDSPTQYMRSQTCTDFMAQVPTVWDETVGVAGSIGNYAAVARRKGKVWFVSAIGNWEPRELTLDLGFIKGRCQAEIFADGINADRDATDYTRTVRELECSVPLTVTLAPGGGWTARLEPVK